MELTLSTSTVKRVEPKSFYVSLVRDLMGTYLKFNAESKDAVHAYLNYEYRAKNGEWKLPWCAVYDYAEFITMPDINIAIVIPAKCKQVLSIEDFKV